MAYKFRFNSDTKSLICTVLSEQMCKQCVSNGARKKKLMRHHDAPLELIRSVGSIKAVAQYKAAAWATWMQAVAHKALALVVFGRLRKCSGLNLNCKHSHSLTRPLSLSNTALVSRLSLCESVILYNSIAWCTNREIEHAAVKFMPLDGSREWSCDSHST